jgi:hypothetical protein
MSALLYYYYYYYYYLDDTERRKRESFCGPEVFIGYAQVLEGILGSLS